MSYDNILYWNEQPNVHFKEVEKICTIQGRTSGKKTKKMDKQAVLQYVAKL